MHLEQRLYVLLDHIGARDWKEGADHREAILADARDLVAHGEPGVALEHLCQYLYEYDVALRAEDLEAIRSLTDAMKMSRSTWDFLESAAKRREDDQC